MTSSVANRDSAPPAPQPAPEEVRLVWASSDEDPPSGAWWPRSRDAEAELQALLPQVSDHLGGAITRVSLNIGAWDADQPRRMRVGDRVVRLGWFHTLDPATVTLARGSDRRVILHIVPPELEPEAARTAMLETSAGSP